MARSFDCGFASAQDDEAGWRQTASSVPLPRTGESGALAPGEGTLGCENSGGDAAALRYRMGLADRPDFLT